ncbi:MAG: PEP-CTERM sorting domain-containing protein [Planctomycetota bacterium]|nr:PEP-CTERM sorting domain-containing protein [Planctomycetota bacterium]
MQTLTVASVATVTALAAGLATAETMTIDLAGVNSNDNFGVAGNHQELAALGNVHVTGIGWDNVVGNGDDTGVTWGNEMRMAVVDSASLSGVFVTFFPSEGSATAGGVWGPASSDGIIDLISNGIDFYTDSGSLLVEMYESYDDASGATDAHYESGTVTIEYAVPAPGALALLGLAGIAGTRRRRR